MSIYRKQPHILKFILQNSFVIDPLLSKRTLFFMKIEDKMRHKRVISLKNPQMLLQWNLQE